MASATALAPALLGRPFVHPLFDYLLVGGLLSLMVTVVVLWNPQVNDAIGLVRLGYIVLACNSAHFAASTVRLYTKPGMYEARPFLTMGFPLVSLAVLTACMLSAGTLGPHFQALYITWSPYHYAAQAYGLAVLYAYRSGCRLTPRDKTVLWWTSLVPFAFVFVSGMGLGLDWLVPAHVLALPAVDTTLRLVAQALPWAAVVSIPLACALVWRSTGTPLPLISVAALISNGVWWFVLDPMGAFTWATIFHGLQYLAIAAIFHVRDRSSQPGNRHGGAYHAAWFYGACLLLGYGLFYCLPWAYAAAGFGLLESIALVVAAINIHHFVVDAFIWRMGKGDRNREIVEAVAPVAA